MPDYIVREINDDTRKEALEWLDARVKKLAGVGYPVQFLPPKGLCAISLDGKTTAILFVLHDPAAHIAVCCHAIVPPEQSPVVTFNSISCILQMLPVYARQDLGCSGIFATFGHRGMNRLLDACPGWLKGDSDAVHHMMIL